MMYDELVKNLRKMENSENCVIVSTEDFRAMQIVKQTADAIEELQKQLDNSEIENIKLKEEFAKYRGKNRWIPVTERLPKDRQRVLVFYWLNLKPKEPWHKVCYFASKLNKVDKYDFDGCNYPGFYDCDSEYGYYQLSDVTHWMPLPEPPKDGE